jgi:hypothetical protein
MCALPLLLLALPPALRAQAQSEDAELPSPIPVLSAGMGFNWQSEGGTPNIHPLFAPVLLLPLGNNFLIESRVTFESVFAPPPGRGSWQGVLDKEVDYAELDYIANRFVTVTAGRYLVPFGIFNERLYPVWIRDLQSDPLILPIATGPSGAGTGAMLRGGFSATDGIELNYAAYFSTLSTEDRLDSQRMAGGRTGIFLLGPRLEFGGSYQHLLQADHSNAFGFHAAWQPAALPLDVRAEYARSDNGSGYWIESAYRLSQVPIWRDEMRRLQVVARMQQFYVGKVPNPSLPLINTNMFEFGLNYYFRDNLRFVSSYGRQFAFLGNENVWTVGLTYRFVLPLWPGGGN